MTNVKCDTCTGLACGDECDGTSHATVKNKRSCPECSTAIMANGRGAHHSADCSMVGTDFNKTAPEEGTMYSRMLKDLEITEVLQEAKRRAENIHGYSAIDKINEAIKLSSSPAEEAQDGENEQDLDGLVDQICEPGSALWGGETSDIDGRALTYPDLTEIKKAIQDYTSSRVQEAVIEERRLCMFRAVTYADNHGQEIMEGNLAGITTDVGE